MPKEYLTPLAVLVGAAVIAVGLYFGLSAKAPVQATTTATATSGSTLAATTPPREVTTPGTPSPPPEPVTPPPTGDAKTSALKAATVAVEAEKKAIYVPKCWKPALEKVKEPAKAKYTLSLSFDAQGKQIAAGVNEDRDAMRADVANCLRQLPMTLKLVPPVGVNVSVEVPLEFP